MDEITYQELINKFNGLSQKVFALARTMDQFHKRNAVPGELPLPVLAIAKEFLSNTSFPTMIFCRLPFLSCVGMRPASR